jgi:hypothetical protein
MMTTVAIGDIHGMYDMLDRLSVDYWCGICLDPLAY